MKKEKREGRGIYLSQEEPVPFVRISALCRYCPYSLDATTHAVCQEIFAVLPQESINTPLTQLSLGRHPKLIAVFSVLFSLLEMDGELPLTMHMIASKLLDGALKNGRTDTAETGRRRLTFLFHSPDALHLRPRDGSCFFARVLK